VKAMKNEQELLDLKNKLSEEARNIFELMLERWPHSWEMKESELTFQNKAKRPMIRVWRHTNEGLTVGVDSAITEDVRVLLIQNYGAKLIPNEKNKKDSLSLSFEQLSPDRAFEFVSLLLEGQEA
jgi:hypothetical protein